MFRGTLRSRQVGPEGWVVQAHPNFSYPIIIKYLKKQHKSPLLFFFFYAKSRLQCTFSLNYIK
jgi:hypothetical protein